MTLNIYRIKVNQKNQQVHQLQSKAAQTKSELAGLKREALRKEQEELTRLATGPENPDVIGHYKGLVQAKDRQLTSLTKRLRAYTLQEKRILMKERAYELEREDNIRRVMQAKNEGAKARVAAARAGL